MTVELSEGSRVVGKDSDDKYEFHSEILGKITLSLESITSIEFQSKTNLAKVTASTGDRLTVAPAMNSIPIKTSFGEVKFSTDSIRGVIESG